MKTFLKILFFFLLVTQICFAQWVQLGLAERHIGEIAVGSTGLFAVTSENGSVFHTTDGGASWFQILDSLGKHVAVAANGTIFMAVGDSLYRSTDGGTSWINLHMLEQINVGLSRMNIYCVEVGPNGNTFSGCWARHVPEDRYGVVNAISTDIGTTWSWGGVWGGEAYSFREHSVITSGYWVAVTTGWAGCAISFDDGQTWTNTDFLLRPPFVWCSNGMIMFREFLYEPWGDGGWLSVSADMGTSVTKVSDITPSALLALPQGRVLVGTDTMGICLFSDNGDSLGTLNEGLSDFHIHTFAMDSSEGYAYVGTNDGVWRRPLLEIVPVELISFTAATNGKEVMLNWSTATELNNHGFEIQRSTEGEEFFTVGFVNGHGTTTEQQNYNFADRILSDGKYFYRLKQVDYDGSYEYSDIVEVDFRTFNSYILEQCYPNPFNPTTTIGFGIQYKSMVEVTVFNAIGEDVAVLLNEEREGGYHQVEFNASSLPSGVYFYRLHAGDFVQTRKMILLK